MEEIKNIDFRIKLSEKQTLAFDELEKDIIREVLYGGAKGGGKSVFLCYYAILYAKKVIDLCNINEVKYPPCIGFIGRKQGVDFNKTTLETWKKMIPSNLYILKEQAKEIVVFGKVRYHIGGLDDESNINKFNSAEYGFVGIDQAEEMGYDDIGTLRGTMGGRAKVNEVILPTKMLLTANPAECFLQQDFFNEKKDYRKFIQALPSDNEFIDSDRYINQLYDAYKNRPELIDAYIKGVWGSKKAGLYLLYRDVLSRSSKLSLGDGKYLRTVVSVDPAWTGKDTDEIVIYGIRNNRVIAERFLYNVDTLVTAAEAMKVAKSIDASLIVIDQIGVGAGVVDNCEKLAKHEGVTVMGVNSAERTFDNEEDKKKFYNRRAEMWWKASELIMNNQFIVPDDIELVDQLCTPKYEIVLGGLVKIEPKEDIKKRLGKSPDRADALVQGIWALDYARSVSKEKKHQSEYSNEYTYNPMTV